MKQLLIFLFLLSSTVQADVYNDDPYAKFSTSNNFTSSVKVNWEIVDNVQETCNQLQVKYSGKPLTTKVYACSKWKNNRIFRDECTIITGKNTTMWTLGHEVRHCFQGSYHK